MIAQPPARPRHAALLRRGACWLALAMCAFSFSGATLAKAGLPPGYEPLPPPNPPGRDGAPNPGTPVPPPLPVSQVPVEDSPPAEPAPASVLGDPADAHAGVTRASPADTASPAAPTTASVPASAPAPMAATTTALETPASEPTLAWWLLVPAAALLLWARLRSTRKAKARHERGNHNT